MRLVVLVVALGACTDWEYTQTAQRVCVSAVDGGATFRAGEPVQLGFSLPGCPSDYGMHCDAKVTFDTIHVTAWMGWNDPLPTACPRTPPPHETCSSRPLAAGTYTIVFGDIHRELTIPSTHAEELCLDSWLRTF